MSMGLALALLLQDSAAAIARLGSDSIEEREEAVNRLVVAGCAATIPALERAARDPDAEVAARAQEVLGRIKVQRCLVSLAECCCTSCTLARFDDPGVKMGPDGCDEGSSRIGSGGGGTASFARSRPLRPMAQGRAAPDRGEAMSVLLALLLQDYSGPIGRLGSDSIEEREEAAYRLLGAGDGAIPALEGAARDADAEVAARAGEVLERVKLHRWLVRLPQCGCSSCNVSGFIDPIDGAGLMEAAMILAAAVALLRQADSNESEDGFICGGWGNPLPPWVQDRSAQWRKDARLRVGVKQ